MQAVATYLTAITEQHRTGRALSWDDLRHYQCIAAALGATIALMAELEGV
jgi:hypothetical protein